MARFVYRLQKVYELRERRKKEQERRVSEAMERLRRAEMAVVTKQQEIKSVRDHMFSSPGFMLESHDIFLQKLNEDLEFLKYQVTVAHEQLEYERQQLLKATMDLEALIKHKEKAYEEYLEEEKAEELKRLDEVASQRYFRQQLEQKLEEDASAE